jgi:hypothetical protein
LPQTIAKNLCWLIGGLRNHNSSFKGDIIMIEEIKAKLADIGVRMENLRGYL